MHQVLKHLLARKNKKVPIKDGKKITLVLFGGGMSGIRAAGAMTALWEMGLAHSFDEIYTISAGFPNASYLVSNQGSFGTSIYWEDLAQKRFINPLRLWKIADIDYMVRVMSTSKKLDYQTVLKNKTKIFSRLYNLKTKKSEYIEVHSINPDDYMKLMRASCSIPYLHPGGTKIGDSIYMDCPLTVATWQNHVQDVLKTNATDILIIPTTHLQYDFVHTHFPNDGRLFQIPLPDEKLKWNELNQEKLKKAARDMGRMVKQLFGQKGEINLEYENRN
jgi:predicted patatin/cPLA2 family phospholipase